jgi:hypothetical protein
LVSSLAKGKGIVVAVHAMRFRWEEGDIAPLCLNLNFPGKIPVSMEGKAGLDVSGKRNFFPCLELNCGSSSSYLRLNTIAVNVQGGSNMTGTDCV